MSTRTMSVGGSFYPSKGSEITAMIDRFNAIIQSHPDVQNTLDHLQGKVFIVPHAGWVYSGFTANIAYQILSRSGCSTCVVIGPSHRVGFEGVSICDAEKYQTPLGDLKIDTQLVHTLRETFSLPYFSDAHHEHSTEVQMPFIKHYLPDAKIVELVYSHTDPASLEPVLHYCTEHRECALIISTDLSHYYPLNEANAIDAICLRAIENENIALLDEGCEACGRIGVEAILEIAKSKGLKARILDYRTSADAGGDSSRVVGYVSALFA